MYFGAWSSFYKEIRYLLYRKETFANNLSCCSGRWSNGDIISLYPTKKNPKVTYLHSILVDFLNWTHKTHFSSSSRKRKPHFVFRTAVILVQQTITLGTQKNRIPETICNLFYGEKKQSYKHLILDHKIGQTNFPMSVLHRNKYDSERKETLWKKIIILIS